MKRQLKSQVNMREKTYKNIKIIKNTFTALSFLAIFSLISILGADSFDFEISFSLVILSLLTLYIAYMFIYIVEKKLEVKVKNDSQF